MDDRFFVPIVTMLVGVALWILFLIARARIASVRGLSPTGAAAICLVAGGIVVFSAVS